MPSAEKRQEERRAFLLALYEMTDADTMKWVNDKDVAEHLGLGPEEGDRIARSVVDHGHAEWKTKGGNMGITAHGINFAEAELSQKGPPQQAVADEPSRTERLIAVLREYLRVIDASYFGDETGLVQGEHPDLADKLRERLPLIQRILNGVEPGLGDGLHPSGSEWPWGGVRNVVLGAIGRLETRQEEEELLGRRGPKLAAEGLHPWVWEVAAKRWENGQRRDALQAAGTAIERRLKNKIRRTELFGPDLVRQAFTLEAPAPDKPRLRFSGISPKSPNYKSAHEGAMQFGAGCMLAIRNIATHKLDEPDEQMALEQLAALSVLARWIDAAEVVAITP